MRSDDASMDRLNVMNPQAREAADEQGDDLLIFFFAFMGNLSPCHMTLAAYAGRYDFAKKLWQEAIVDARAIFIATLDTGIERTDNTAVLLRDELAHLYYFDKWWNVATSMLKPFNLHFTFKHRES